MRQQGWPLLGVLRTGVLLCVSLQPLRLHPEHLSLTGSVSTRDTAQTQTSNKVTCQAHKVTLRPLGDTIQLVQ